LDQIERGVADSAIHLGVIARHRAGATSELGLTMPLSWELIYRAGSPTSEKSLRFVETRLQVFSESRVNEQLRQLGVTAVMPAAVKRHPIQFTGAPVFSLAALIPLILVLTTVTGAVYPAIDLTAGERERGTLEMLIAAPVPRLGLLLGKYVAVLAVALVTAIVNLVGMTITAQSTGLSAMLFPSQGMSLAVVLKVWLLLCLLAAFFSAVLLAITSYARSFKEAQAYIIPLMLVCLVPGVICLLPSLEFTPALAVTPLMNIVMLSRDVLEGDVSPVLAAAAVLSTAIYVAAAIALAARIFGTDAVLYGSPATWSDILRRPSLPQAATSPSAAMFALAIMFPTYFILAGSLAQSYRDDLPQRMALSALVTVLVFVAIPAAVSTFHRARPASGLGLRKTPWLAMLAAVILGLALWPFAHELFLFNQWLGITSFASGQVTLVREFADELRRLPWALVLVTLALAPGVCEEFFFRGLLFGALRRTLSPTATVVATAILFGLFHVVGGNVFMPERFLPSAFLGLALGWVRLRTGSILPSILLHAIHNGFLLSIMYWQDELQARGIGVEDAIHLPLAWLAAAALAVFAGALLLVAATRRRSNVAE
ncbi:MAG: CPBP family glutamic-type intramembrane protease, partial [Pirellulales bacterium]